MIKKIISHSKQGTLLSTAKQYLTVKLKLINPLFYYELVRYKFNGGFYEKPKRYDFYDKKNAGEYLKLRANTEFWRKEQETVESFLNSLPNGLKVLDVPFGTGRFVDFYKKKNFSIYGLEKSQDMIDNAKRHLGNDFENCNVKQGDAINIPFEDKSFDLVVCFRFTPHILTYEDSKKSIEEISRVSKDYVIIQVGERDNNYYRRRLPNKNEKMSTWLYPKEVEELLLSYKLKVIEKSSALHPAPKFTTTYLRNPGSWKAYLCKKII